MAVFVLLLTAAAAFGFFYFDITGRSQAAFTATPMPVVYNQAFVLPVTQISYLPIRDFNVPDPDISARAIGLYDVVSSKFLFSKNADLRLPIASITKLMSAVVILENINMSDIISVPSEAVNVDGQGADFIKGERLLGLDLLKMMLIKSSNDAAVTFDQYAKNQGIDLVQKMNEKARDLGMADTKFLDPSGLNDNGVSSVRDLVELVLYINQRHTNILSILRTASDTILSYDGTRTHNVINTDQLLGKIDGIIGGKTGFTNASLGSLLLEVSLQDNKNMLISVILGSNDRFSETTKLIRWGKTAFRWE